MSFDRYTLHRFQVDNLGYQFKNIELLTDALTHSTENEKCNPFYRLQVLGNAVLKLVSSEYTIQSSGLADPGILTRKRKDLINISTGQTPAGIKLFGIANSLNLNSSKSILKISRGVLENPTFTGVPYHKFLKAVFGAVFLDAGGSKGAGIEECMKLFLNLWQDFDIKINSPALDSCFPVHRKISEFWLKMGMDSKFTFIAELCFAVKFINTDLLCEALIHKSFYDPIMNNNTFSRIHMPHYERLEFLGDSVLGLIITEFTYHKYGNSEAATVYERANDLVNAEHLEEVAERLKIRDIGLVRTQKNVVFESCDDILEAVIGAIYVDSGEDVAMEFILREFQLSESEIFTFESLNWKPRQRPEEEQLRFRRILAYESVSNSMLTTEEWLDREFEKAKPYQVKKSPQNSDPGNGMLYKCFCNYILPIFRMVAKGCMKIAEFVLCVGFVVILIIAFDHVHKQL
ncbi:unnamed protein product [Orchesella dallaii]|uniref:RNase III domain-containing protein n=1 Tax=Orchesella dallaii TaxID=48710 RepID=A0ABP1S0J4_9HEXA